MAAIIVTKPEDGLISFSSEKKNDPMFGKHTDSDVWAPKKNKDANTQDHHGRGKESQPETARLQGDF